MSFLHRLAVGFPTSWSHRRQWSTGSLALPGVGEYFVSWDPGSGTYGEGWSHEARDACGVLLQGREGRYHPIRIAQFGLHRYGVWHATSDEQARADVLAQAAWLRDNQERGVGEGRYRFSFAWKKYGAKAGWCSAMAQGEAISLLLRAYLMEPLSGFGDAAARAAQPFRIGIERGGVVWQDGDDLFLEEIANEYAAHVLNGCIFALWGIWELWKRSGDSWLEEIIERCVLTLQRWLPRFDTGWWTLYSLMRTTTHRPHVATLKYHAFHIAQMRVLHEMFGVREFHAAANRWEEYALAQESRNRLVIATLRSLPDRLLGLDTVEGGARA